MKSFISLLSFATKITNISLAKLPTDVKWQLNSKIVKIMQKIIYTKNCKDTIKIPAEMSKAEVVFL